MNTDLELRGKNLLTLNDLTDQQMIGLVGFAEELKQRKKQGTTKKPLLTGKNIALIFEKSSTRTRCSAVVAAGDEAAHAEYLGKNDIHLGKKETVEDTARVIGRMFDGIFFRGFKHQTIVTLGKYAGVPVWNGLTDDSHPVQILADLQTIKEKFNTLKDLKIAFVGDGRSNVCNSLMLGCAKAGINFVNCCPEELSPNATLVENAEKAAKQNNAHIEIIHDSEKAVIGAHAVYTDVWTSMGEESRFAERVQLLRPYQVNMAMMRQTGNLESNNVIFLHCLPAFHNNETEVTREIGALEVTDEVFKAPFSKVFDEAENRMHTMKAVMIATLT